MPPEPQSLVVIVLAAGQGTRMRSGTPKVLHEVGGLAMVRHVLRLATGLSPARLGLVLAPGMEAVAAAARAEAPATEVFIQERAQGTADAVRAAQALFAGHTGTVLVLYGDTPLLTRETVLKLTKAVGEGAGIAVLGFEARPGAEYGHLVQSPSGDLEAIVEHAEADATERAARLSNSGVMAFTAALATSELPRIARSARKGEFYLTDLVALARAAGHRAAVAEADEAEVLGINSRADLAEAEAAFQARARAAAMAGGATLLDPDTVYFAHDTVLGRDVTVGQNVVFGPGVVVADEVSIRPFCHLEGARVARGAVVGPFARLRPGADLGESVHVGNFCEIKKARLGPGAKVNHLTYIGDAEIGARTNIGAGTITCNYDGFDKSLTRIGADVFIGSDTLLIAPVSVGDGAYTGSGTVVTKDVAPNTLAVTRPELKTVEGWPAKFRARKTRGKAERAQSGGE
ncbi:MAG: bifunctional UDP-N-acetylglucosamine diphosphorylase/glucosamine-1-phosphate N-acetyltransferase GlmU [Alphaproteobacteria bacterium]|nr:bifunctional UDP-N-acetylglucosamine diphosphorylase/glucosamine-1-phosphate N-acetyltransferase GlmU [Alphaproteobacteria bacterium]